MHLYSQCWNMPAQQTSQINMLGAVQRKVLNLSLETAKLGFDICDPGFWPLTFTFCMNITYVNGSNCWKFHDDMMRGTLWKSCDRRMSLENLFSAAMKKAALHTCFFFLALWLLHIRQFMPVNESSSPYYDFSATSSCNGLIWHLGNNDISSFFLSF